MNPPQAAPLSPSDPRDRDALLAEAFADAPIGMVFTTPDGLIVDANAAYFRMIGYTLNEIVGGDSGIFTHPDDVSATRDFFASLQHSSTPAAVFEKRYIHKDGHLVWGRVSGTMQFDSAGRPRLLLAIIEDVTARKTGEVALAEKAKIAALGSEVGAALTGIAPLRDSLQRCAEAVVESLDVALARIWTLALGDEVLQLEASAGLYTHLNGAHARIPVGAFKIGMIARERRPHCSNDVCNDPHVSNPEWAKAEGMVAFAGHPLVVDDRVIGVLGVFGRRSLGEDVRSALASVADNIAVGIKRKRAEEALQQQWQVFDAALSHTPDFAYTFDLEGRFTYANRSLLQLWQKPLSEALGKNYWDLKYPPELAEKLHQQIAQVIETRQPLRDEMPYTSPSGHSGHYDHIFVPVLGPHGTVEAVAGSTRDITAAKRASEDLRKSEERLQLALAAGGGIGTWDWDVREKRVYCNGRFAELFCWPAEVVAHGAPVSNFLRGTHPADREGLSRELRKAMASTDIFSAEFRLLPPDGAVRWVYARGQCHFNEAGQPVRFPGVVFDISDRKSIEEDLRNSETRRKFVAESIPQMVWTATPDGALDYVNRRGTDYFGISEAMLLGSGWLSLVHQEDHKETIDRWMHCIQTGEPYEVSFRLLRGKDKTWRWHLARALAFIDDQGTIDQWFGSCTDIEDQKVAESELRRANRELEEFAYVAGHDLQEPLRSVNIYTELLMRRFGADQPEAQRYAGVVRQGVQRMDALIRDLLTFSSTVQGEQRVLSPAALGQALDEGLAVLKDRIDESEAEIVRDCELPVIRGEIGQLAHVFQNILSNAIKYRAKDRPLRIVISATRAGSEWLVAIKDNGIGFDAQYAKRIFGLFKRLHKSEYPGTGLGLAICERIVERHGGRIWAESAEGVGSTFYFTLPAQ